MHIPAMLAGPSIRRLHGTLLFVVALVLTACGSDGSGTAAPATEAAQQETAAAPDGGSSVRVAVITSLSGPLQPYGEQFLAGVHAGLDYATDGTREVDGTAIELAEVDDASNAEQAVAAMTEEIGSGAKIVTGSISSGIAIAQAPLADQNKVLYLSGPASTDAITGINDYTFRVGRQTYQDVITVRGFIGDPEGKKVVVFAQDTAYGQSNVDSVTKVLGAEGAEVRSILVPEGANDLTPFAADVAAEEADVVLVAWVGTETSAAMWQALDQQGVFDVSTVSSILDVAATYPVYYPPDIAPNIDFIGHYYPGVSDNEASQALDAGLEGSGQPHDIYTNDGFIAGQMIAQAVGEAGDDVEGMISALEGWSFEAPKGDVTIRAEDHALLQPMFPTQMIVEGEEYTPTVLETIAAEDLAPPLPGE